MTKHQRHLARTRAIQRRRRFDRKITRDLLASAAANPGGIATAHGVLGNTDVHIWTWKRTPDSPPPA